MEVSLRLGRSHRGAGLFVTARSFVPNAEAAKLIRRGRERNGATYARFFQAEREQSAEDRMLKLAILFLIISIIAGLFGFTGISAAAAGIAKVLFFIFIVAFLVFLILGLVVGSAIF